MPPAGPYEIMSVRLTSSVESRRIDDACFPPTFSASLQSTRLAVSIALTGSLSSDGTVFVAGPCPTSPPHSRSRER